MVGKFNSRIKRRRGDIGRRLNSIDYIEIGGSDIFLGKKEGGWG